MDIKGFNLWMVLQSSPVADVYWHLLISLGKISWHADAEDLLSVIWKRIEQKNANAALMISLLWY